MKLLNPVSTLQKARTKKEMIEYLSSHFTALTALRSWNRMTAYAQRQKLLFALAIERQQREFRSYGGEKVAPLNF